MEPEIRCPYKNSVCNDICFYGLTLFKGCYEEMTEVKQNLLDAEKVELETLD